MLRKSEEPSDSVTANSVSSRINPTPRAVRHACLHLILDERPLERVCAAHFSRLGQPSPEQPRGAGKGYQDDDGERQKVREELGEAGALQINPFGEVKGVEKTIDDHGGLKEWRHTVDRCDSETLLNESSSTGRQRNP